LLGLGLGVGVGVGLWGFSVHQIFFNYFAEILLASFAHYFFKNNFMNSSSFFNKCKIHTNEIQTQIMFDQTRMLLMSFFISQKTEEQILGISKRMFPVSIAEKVFF